jgi:hypothetical protein
MALARLLLIAALLVVANLRGYQPTTFAAVDRVAGHAFDVAMGAPPTPVDGTPSVVLPPGGGSLSEESRGRALGTLGVTGFIEEVSAATTGSLAGDSAQVVSTSKLRYVELFGGLIRASEVQVSATATISGDRASASSNVTFANLTIAGLPVPSPAANERVELPGLGYVIVNVRLVGGDNRGSASALARALHVYITSPNVLDLPVGSQIIVAEAAAGVPTVSASRQVGDPRPAPTVPQYPALAPLKPLDLSFNDNGGGNGNLDFDDLDDDNDNDDNGNGNGGGATATPTRTSSSGTPITIVVTVVVVQPTSTPVPTATSTTGPR